MYDIRIRNLDCPFMHILTVPHFIFPGTVIEWGTAPRDPKYKAKWLVVECFEV